MWQELKGTLQQSITSQTTSFCFSFFHSFFHFLHAQHGQPCDLVCVCVCALGQQHGLRSTCGLVAMTSASHAEGRQFDPGQVYGVSILWKKRKGTQIVHQESSTTTSQLLPTDYRFWHMQLSTKLKTKVLIIFDNSFGKSGLLFKNAQPTLIRKPTTIIA